MIDLQTQAQRPNYQSFHLLDEDGFLVDAHEWSREFTHQRAVDEGLELNEKHWQLIELLRDKYLTLGALPPMRTVCKAVGLDRNLLKAQFGSCLRLWKLAGLPNPGEEAIAYMN